MEYAVVIVLAGALGVWLEVPGLRRKKLYRELRLFSIALLAAIAIGIIKSLQLPFPNLMEWIMIAVSPLVEWFGG
ncbi:MULTISPECIES: hypothetical protein [Paenibacillus]|uniref:Uncharacterized protein n=1 Tax=Paenibacillus residui TaxID=629724 RepID=A0ABW3DE42_9BACL|nr:MULTISPECIES: hypothetical protein [Paenibacillaceae]